MGTESKKLKILIAGGGIGGLTASLCLARQGHEILLFEQAPVFSEVGAGLQLAPNCSRVLHDLGLETSLRRHAFLPEATQFRNWRSGKVIAESTLGESVVERYGLPYYHIHRGDLVHLLAEAATQMPNISLFANTQVTGFNQSAGGVSLQAGGGTQEGDLLIGADGIHSVIRSGLWGDQKPRFTGNVAWRALVPADKLPKGLIRPMSTAWWGPNKHFVHYYVRRGELVNCVCVVEKEGWEVESWTQQGDLDELKSDFSGWHDDLQQLLAQVDKESLFKWALFDRAPMTQWGQGRVTLLGDASHPTLPFMAQGAAMAIEDSAVLAGCLEQCIEQTKDIPAGLQRYEDLRRERTGWIQNGSRRNAKVFHLTGIKAWLRDRAAKTAGQRTMDSLYRYNALEAAGKSQISDDVR